MPPMSLHERGRLATIRAGRFLLSLRRPGATANARLARRRGETLGVRRAVAADVPALAALHVETWNDTYAPISGSAGAPPPRTRRPRVPRAGDQSTSAFVEPSNPSCRFFEAVGGEWRREPDGRLNFDWYVWSDLRALAARCPAG